MNSKVAFGVPIIQDFLNLFLTERGNQISRERANEAVGHIDRLNEDFDAERGQWTQDFFRTGYDPSRFDAGQFKSSTDFDALLSNLMSLSWEGENQAVDALTGAMKDPMAIARDAGSFVDDLSLDAYQRDAINDITGSSKARMGQASQDMIARVLSQGRSMGESRDALAALNYNEGINRSNAIDSVAANAENMRNQNMQYRAGLQNQAMLDTLGTNAALSNAKAGLHMQGGQDRSNAWANTIKFQHDVEDRDQVQAFDAYMNKLGIDQSDRAQYTDMAKYLLGSKQQNVLTQAGIISGTPFTIAQSSGLQSGVQNVLQQQAIGAARAASKSQGSFSFFGIGGGGGCIAWNSTVTTKRGPVPIAGVLPGDEVMGEDGEFRRVVGKDCGTVEQGERRELLTIQTDSGALTATADHTIDGKRADRWQAGELITVGGKLEPITAIVASPYTQSADLILEGNVPYLANGFPVHSNIGAGGMESWRDAVSRIGRQQDGLIRSDDNPNGVWALAA